MTKNKHFLDRPGTIPALWLLFLAILAVTVVADFFVEHHGVFGIEASFAFNAWYGFAACTAIILASKFIAVFVKRSDRYYDDGDGS